MERYRLLDEEEVSHEPRSCMACGKTIFLKLDRGLVYGRGSCSECDLSKADSCKVINPAQMRPVDEIKQPLDGIKGLTVEETEQRVFTAIVHLPRVEGSLDAVDARALYANLCCAYALPMLDDERFLMTYSRYAVEGTLPNSRVPEFFYSLFKRLLAYLCGGTDSPRLSPFFEVLHGLEVDRVYKFRKRLGSGSFGVIREVKHKSSGITRVCKSIVMDSTARSGMECAAEVRILAQLDHPNIVRMYEFYLCHTSWHLILENCRGGNLSSKIDESIQLGRSIPTRFVKTVLQQILCALSFLSTRGIVHKDLKPENVMLMGSDNFCEGLVVKVIDFGLSEMFSSARNTSSTMAGTAFYMSPQMFAPPFTTKCDIWSAGCIAYFMLTGCLPFVGSDMAEVKSNVLYRKLTWPVFFAAGDSVLALEEDAKCFVEMLLEKDERTRPSACSALRHAWLATLNSSSNNIAFSQAVVLNIRTFSRFGWIKRSILVLIAHMWDFDRGWALREIFCELDTENRGFVSAWTLVIRFQQNGFTAAESWKMALSLDICGAGTVAYTQLTGACIVPLLDSDEKVIKLVFDIFCPNRSGLISSTAVWDVLSGKRSAFSVISNSMKYDKFTEALADETHAFRGKHLKSSVGCVSLDYFAFRSWIMSVIP